MEFRQDVDGIILTSGKWWYSSVIIPMGLSSTMMSICLSSLKYAIILASANIILSLVIAQRQIIFRAYPPLWAFKTVHWCLGMSRLLWWVTGYNSLLGIVCNSLFTENFNDQSRWVLWLKISMFCLGFCHVFLLWTVSSERFFTPRMLLEDFGCCIDTKSYTESVGNVDECFLELMICTQEVQFTEYLEWVEISNKVINSQYQVFLSLNNFVCFSYICTASHSTNLWELLQLDLPKMWALIFSLTSSCSSLFLPPRLSARERLWIGGAERLIWILVMTPEIFPVLPESS